MPPRELLTDARLDVQALAACMLDNDRAGFEVVLSSHAPLPGLCAEAGKLLRDAAAYALRHLWDVPGDHIDLVHCWQSSQHDIRTALVIQHSVYLDTATWDWLTSVMTAGPDQGEWVPASDQCLALAAALYTTELLWQAMPRSLWPAFLAEREA
jgi:hypothetical protein